MVKHYISGPMTGYQEHNFPAFKAEAERLRNLSQEVVSPHEMDGGDTSLPWDYYLCRDLKAMLDCGAVVILPGWFRSRGARLETYVANALGMPIYWRGHNGYYVKAPESWFDSPLPTECDPAQRRSCDEAGNATRAPKVTDAFRAAADLEDSCGSISVGGLAADLGMPVSASNVSCKCAEPKPENVLAEASRLIFGDRQSAYGHPFDDFTRTGRMWAAILGLPEVTPEQVALCMVAVKISRECNLPKRDNRVDGPGYFGCLEMVIQRRAELAAEDDAA